MINKIYAPRTLQIFLFVTGLSVFSTTITLKAQNLPKYSNSIAPSPLPAAPGESFSAPMAGSAAAGTPVCAEWTRTAGPDESLVITGMDFTKFSGPDEGKDSRFTVYGASGRYKDASIQRLEKNKAVITLDKSIPAWSMYLIWPGNEAGYGQPIAINKTDAWWVGPEKATQGSNVSVYGRNLSQYNDSTSSNVYLKSPTGSGQWLTVTKVNPYKVDFILPASLANGEYEVWTHNGHGGEYGWSGPLKLTINSGVTWTQTTFNVKDYGAKGNGQADDTDAIYKALAAAKNSTGSTVYFPQGTYMISRMLNPSHNTQWKGDGQDKTFIKCNSSFSSQSDAMVYGIVNTFQVSDLTFDTNKNYRAIHSSPFFLRGSSNVKVNNVTLSFQNYDVLQLDNTRGVFLSNCKFIGKISFLGKASQLFIDRCNFYLTNDTENALHSWGGSNISITHSTCQDYNNTDPANGAGWGKGRFFCATGNFGSGGTTYIGNTSTFDLTVRESADVDQNSGEQFLWEGFSANWSGSVASSSGATTTLNGFSLSLDKPKIAVIIKGRGLGQSRAVISASGSTINLEKPWNLQPDASSVVAVGHFADKIVMFNNFIDGKAYAVTSPNPSASAGIEPYGGVFNFIADKNTISEVRAAIANWSTQHSTGVDPNYFSLYTNNKIVDCRWAIQNGLDMYRPAETALLATTFRKNKIGTTLQSGIINTIMPTATPVLENFIYEHNEFLNVRSAFSTGGDLGLPNGFPSSGDGIANQFLYKNNFGSSANLSGITITQKISLRENTFSGFAIPYSGTLQGPAIGGPLHVIEMAGTVGNVAETPFSIWNSGTAEMNWKASSNATWLKLSDTVGVISDERASSNLSLKADASALSIGNHTANITVVAGTITKKYTILFEVTASTPPKVAITSPAFNSKFISSSAIVITADASDTDGTISKVEFFNGTTKLGETLSSPFTFNWTNASAGTFSLTAKATDNSGLSTVSAPIEISVSTPVIAVVAPVVSLTSSASKSIVTAPAAFTISANATDQDGTIAKVEFFAGTTKLGEALTSPYSFDWSNIAAGTYAVTAKATDNSGLSTTSDTLQLTISNPVLSSCSDKGSIVWEYWSSIAGSNNISAIPVTSAPSGTRTLTSFASPVEFGDDYGSRIRGYICPPVSGNYVFYIASDDNGELWLSTNSDPANKRKIASVNDWTTPGWYDRYPSQQSVVIALEAGQRYYIEALHKEGGGSQDHLSVGWKLPDGTLQRPIAGANLIPFETITTQPALTVAPTVAITAPAAGVIITAPATTTITASATDQDGTIAKVEFFAGATKLGEDLTSPYSFAWNNIAAGTYSITAKATDNTGLSTASAAVSITINNPVLACSGTGNIVWEYWSNIAGSNNISAIPVTSAPSGTRTLTSFASPVEFGDDYGSRIRGYICPPVSGNYVFYIASDDNGELWLSTNSDPANKRKIASVNDWTTPGWYDRYPSQQSVVIALEAGQRYYIEALHKEGGGSQDHVSVGWKLPDGTLQRPIAGSNLIPFETITTQPALTVAPTVAMKAFENNALATPGVTYISASATDPAGRIEKVEFFAGDTKLGEVFSSPYTIEWKDVLPGHYVLTAKATNSFGISATSDKVEVTVNRPVLVATDYNLKAYPNPFQQYITIEFTGVEKEDAFLQIYNLQGILLETLYRGKTETGQTYRFQFDGSRYPAGSYLSKLVCGKNAFTNVLILAK